MCLHPASGQVAIAKVLPTAGPRMIAISRGEGLVSCARARSSAWRSRIGASTLSNLGWSFRRVSRIAATVSSWDMSGANGRALSRAARVRRVRKLLDTVRPVAAGTALASCSMAGATLLAGQEGHPGENARLDREGSFDGAQSRYA